MEDLDVSDKKSLDATFIVRQDFFTSYKESPSQAIRILSPILKNSEKNAQDFLSFFQIINEFTQSQQSGNLTGKLQTFLPLTCKYFLIDLSETEQEALAKVNIFDFDFDEAFDVLP